MLYLLLVLCLFLIHRSSKPKITKVDPAFISEQDIVWLDVSMNDADRVQKLDGWQQIVNQSQSMFFVEVLWLFLKEWSEIMWQVVHHKEDVLLSVWLADMHNIMKLDRINIILHITQLFHNLYLTYAAFDFVKLSFVEDDAFDSTLLLGWSVDSSYYLSMSSLAKYLHQFVLSTYVFPMRLEFFLHKLFFSWFLKLIYMKPAKKTIFIYQMDISILYIS